jgi:hypothetical protein
MSRAAASAGAHGSASGCGAPKNAMTPSPMNLSSVPPDAVNAFGHIREISD